MIPLPAGVRVWLAVGRTDMRRGMDGLALQVQETLGRNAFAGDLFVFRGTRGNLIKVLWHDGLGLSLYAKRLERGRFVWPSATNGTVSISAAQLAYMLDGIDWRNPVHTPARTRRIISVSAGGRRRSVILSRHGFASRDRDAESGTGCRARPSLVLGSRGRACSCQERRRCGDDRAPEPRDRQAEAPALRSPLRARIAPPRSDGARVRRTPGPWRWR